MNQNKRYYNIKDLADKIVKEYSIVDVVKNYINLTKKGEDYKAVCPFHNDTNPSLSVSPKLKLFNCFACNTKGNAIIFVQKFKNISYLDAIKEIVELLNINTNEIKELLSNSEVFNKEQEEIFKINEEAAFIFHRTLFNKENEKILNYLKNERQISEEIIDFYQIGYAPNNFNGNYLYDFFQNSKDDNLNRPSLLLKSGLIYLSDDCINYVDFFKDRLIIPIKNEFGKIAGFSGRSISNSKVKYLNTKTTEVFKKENLLFNFYSFNKSKYEEIFIVEGFMDVFALKKIGIENAVASMGTSFTDNHINLIKRYKNIKSIIICFDNDNAGREATKALVEKLSKENFNIFVVSPYEKTIKDIDELVKLKSKEESLQIINNQISFIQYLIENLKEKDLSYKDKKVEVEKIVSMINGFAYNPFFITEDLESLSKYANINVNVLEEMINKKNRFYINRKNYIEKINKRKTIAQEIFSDYKENDFQLFKKDNNAKRINLIDQIQKKAENKERTLIPLLLYSRSLTNYFDDFIGYVHFNLDGILNNCLRLILNHARERKDNNLSFKETINNLFNDPFLGDEDKKYLIKFLKDFNNKYNNKIENEEEIVSWGLKIIEELVIAIYRKKIAAEQELETMIERENIKIEKENKINKIHDLIENIKKSIY